MIFSWMTFSYHLCFKLDIFMELYNVCFIGLSFSLERSSSFKNAKLSLELYSFEQSFTPELLRSIFTSFFEIEVTEPAPCPWLLLHRSLWSSLRIPWLFSTVFETVFSAMNSRSLLLKSCYLLLIAWISDDFISKSISLISFDLGPQNLMGACTITQRCITNPK